MYQLTFNAQSQRILEHLSQAQQMELIDFLSGFDFGKTNFFGKIIHGEKIYYRLRWKEFRIYFECVKKNAFVIHYLLPKHTWNDFLFRANLPFNEELIEKDEHFWQFLEHLKK